ncbi:MFS transporter [Paraburkholderia dipogonis]|uniref:MFS transporter n=1 Tax=Paraburkholderia dipogonis TaxID=1211383 RepID=A0A4Y8MH63_9BURK|nr:MFS transporter [Paraburkholderia dipogonis]TFE36792.1 MFS transporter [Paraburkholderia dipogonis]
MPAQTRPESTRPDSSGQAGSSDAPVAAPYGLVLAIAALGLGGLFIGTGEFASMSLLPGLSADTAVSLPMAGSYISSYALGVVIGSPVIAVLASRWSRRSLLVALLSLVVIGYAASALAWDFRSLLVARFLSGLPHGAYYGVASLAAAAMVPANRRATAIGYVMLGLAAANLVGVPAATWVGDHVGWRAVFASVAIGGALTATLVIVVIPKLTPTDHSSPLQELSALGRPMVWLTLLTASVGFGGMFAVYTYITPTLTHVSGFSQQNVPEVLALWGLGMVAGNLIGGRLADRALIPSIFGMLIWNVVFLGLFTFASASKPASLIVLFLVGNGFALVPALQTRLMNVAGKAQTFASSLNHSAFNISNAVGAAMGGIAIAAGYGWASTGAVGAVLALAGIVPMAASLSLAARQRARYPAGPSATRRAK